MTTNQSPKQSTLIVKLAPELHADLHQVARDLQAKHGEKVHIATLVRNAIRRIVAEHRASAVDAK